MPTDTAHTPPDASRSPPRPLGEEGRLRLYASACLPVRYPDAECGLCASACPVAAITLDGGSPDLRRDCLGCGQCAATCPTSALETDGFLTADVPGGTTTIKVDCWRVPLGEVDRGTLRVPCLGGISAGWLMDVFDRGGERPIRLLDRGGCATCPAGAGLAAAKAAVVETRVLLAELGLPAEVMPKVVTRADRARLLPAIPGRADAQAMGRRGFFRDLAGTAVRALSETVDAPATLSFRNTIPPVERMRLIAALARIARRHGHTVPAHVLPNLTQIPCAAHGVCAAVCPTGALHQSGAGNLLEMRFLAALCLGCGECARACPERAIRVEMSGGQMPVTLLARWTARECEACGRSFFGAAGDLCPRCDKEAHVTKAMAALFQPSV